MPHSKGMNYKRMHFKHLQNPFDIKHLEVVSDSRQFLSFFFFFLLMKILLKSVIPEAHFIYALHIPVVSM